MKLTITIGVPASGKTTWAHKTAKHEGNTRLVSRDDIRLMLFGPGGYKITEEKETLVSRVAEDTVIAALTSGKNVIVHDTNLKQISREKWKSIANLFGAEFEEKFFDLSIVQLLRRNHTRGDKALPVSRIWTHYKNYRIMTGWKPAIDNADPNLPKCVIFDVDGTLTTVGQRSPYDMTKVIDDPDAQHITELFRMYQRAGYTCVVVSGRTGNEQCANDTKASLEKYGVHPSDIFMRRADDTRHDFDVKEEILLTKILPKYYPVLALDDRDTPVGMWRINGIPCLQANYGDF